MKKVINGKRYNTKTATPVANFHNKLSYNDFGYLEETIFITQKGNWFLVGSGGAKTKYSIPDGNGRKGSSDQFIALTDSEAFDWLEQHNETQALEKYFGDQIEDA